MNKQDWPVWVLIVAFVFGAIPLIHLFYLDKIEIILILIVIFISIQMLLYLKSSLKEKTDFAPWLKKFADDFKRFDEDIINKLRLVRHWIDELSLKTLGSSGKIFVGFFFVIIISFSLAYAVAVTVGLIYRDQIQQQIEYYMLPIQGIATVFVGVAGLIGILFTLFQVSRIGHRRYNTSEFLQELEAVLRSVRPQNKAKSAAESSSDLFDADFYYLCMVHDPGFPDVLAKRDFMSYAQLFYKILHDSELKVRVAILNPWNDDIKECDINWENFSKGDGGNLFKFLNCWAKDANSTKSRNFTSEYFSCLNENAIHESRLNGTDPEIDNLSMALNIFYSNNHGTSESNAEHYQKASIALFRVLFAKGVEIINDSNQWRVKMHLLSCSGHDNNESPLSDADKLRKCMKSDHTVQTSTSATAHGNNNHNNLTPINLFFSRTRGMIAFLSFGPSGSYTVEVLPVHDEKFVGALRNFYESIVKDTKTVYLK